MSSTHAITLEEMHQIELEIMDYLHDLCEQNGIKYFLAGGTLIGAIRHKGFIPWDDDMDIFMPRNDYERLKEILKKQTGKIIFINEDSQGNYFSFGKMVNALTGLMETDKTVQVPNMGVFIDIFPIDGIPEDEKSAKRHYNHVKWYDKLKMQYAYQKVPETSEVLRRIYRIIVWYWAHMIGLERLNSKEHSILLSCPYENSKKVCNYFGAYGMKEVIPSAYLQDRVLADFEGRKYYIPAAYDEFLSLIYGDYMQMPPEEKRVSRHDIIAWWK